MLGWRRGVAHWATVVDQLEDLGACLHYVERLIMHALQSLKNLNETSVTG